MLTQEEKDMLLLLVTEKADQNENERNQWNDIYWKLVSLETKEL